MRASLVLVLLAGLAPVGCGGKEPSGPAVVAGAPAGKVTEVSGEVSAVRGEARRPLALGDTVSGDDVIETGAGGRITIVLDHNQVPLSLGPGRRQAIGGSAAWSAPRAAAVAVTSGDRSGAAGRHAERSAADTLASAAPAPAMAAAPSAAPAPPPAEDVVAAAPSPPSPPTRRAAPTRGADVTDEPPRVRRTADEDVARAPGGGPDLSPSPDPDPPKGELGQAKDDPKADPALGGRTMKTMRAVREVSPTDGHGLALDTAVGADSGGGDGGSGGGGDGGGSGSPTTGGGSAKAAAPRVASLSALDIRGGLAADAVLATVRTRAAALQACVAAAAPSTRYTLSFTVDRKGAVTARTATGGDARARTCLTGELARLRFATAATPTTARLALTPVAP